MANVQGSKELVGVRVRNPAGEDLGKIEELMIDTGVGSIAYAVLSFGGILGIGDKLFAIPWEALTLDIEDGLFILNVDKERLKAAPGFDKSHWPDFADRQFGAEIYGYYNYSPYWEDDELEYRKRGS
jgi:hypothetical protein